MAEVRLTRRRGGVTQRFPIRWGAATARERGPVVGTVTGMIVAIVLVVYLARWRKPGEKSGIWHNSNKTSNA